MTKITGTKKKTLWQTCRVKRANVIPFHDFWICVSFLGMGRRSPILSRLTISVMKKQHDQKSGEERIYLAQVLTSLFIIKTIQYRNKSKQGRNLEAEAYREATEGCLVAFSLWLSQHAFLQKTGLSAQGWPHLQLVESSHLSLLKKMLYKLACNPVGCRHFLY